MKTTKACCAAAMAAICSWVVAPASAVSAATARNGDVVAFCRAHPTVDFPDRLYFGSSHTPGGVPQQLSKLEGLSKWRCMAGRVWVCGDSADGDWCSKKDASRRPSAILQDACHDDPESTSLDFAEEHYSAFDWRCKGGKPVVIQSYPLDLRGFFKASWTPVVVQRGVVVGPTELPDGPR